MPIFKISGVVAVSCYTEVEANTPDEALSIASKRDIADFHIDSSYEIDEYFHLESDGTPTELYIEE